MSIIITFVSILAQVLMLAIFARAILSWFPSIDSSNPMVALVYQVTEPVLKPLRSVIPNMGGMDITPLVAIIALLLIRRILG